MKRLSVFLTIVLFLLSSVLISAQENDEGILEDIPEETLVTDIPTETQESAEGSVTEPDISIIASADAVTSASLIKPRPGHELTFLQKIFIALAIIAAQVFLIWFIWYLFRKLNNKLEHAGKNVIKPLIIKNNKLLTTKQIIVIIEVFLKLLKYLITGILLFITIPMVFSLFDATKNLASTLFGYVLNPLRDIATGTVRYIPNLIKIIIIVTITKYVLMSLKYFTGQIEKGKIKLNGFYPDWAAPTFRLLQVLLWAFTIAIVYPYLPGSDSRAFQGVSVFVGIIFSFGSSTAIGNLVAGFVITYMRPFKIGDRVKIKEITGFVVEKNLMVVRLKTHKNEYVTFSNMVILGSNIINYNTSSDEDEEGLIIFAEVTFGYSTPWQTVHDILLKAALNTEHVQKEPKPFVLQTKLDDFYACYQINCYTKEVSKVPRIYTLLYENIQNGFSESGLDLTSSHYRVISTNKN